MYSRQGRRTKMRLIKITAGKVSAGAELKDTPTADAIWDALPISGAASIWGDEIYFGIPVKLGLEEEAQEVVELGDLGYWPAGHAFCIFFGRTPASLGDEIRPASAVNVFGKVSGDPKVFKAVRSGETVTIERV
jgi:hypothetical protein